MDEVLLGKAAIIERCLKRIADEYVGHEAELGSKLISMVGFRNVAVHNYQELDLDILRSILAERLGDLRTFSALLLRAALP